MSTAALYHAFSIYGYPLKGLSFEGGILFIEVEVPDAKLQCPVTVRRTAPRRGAVWQGIILVADATQEVRYVDGQVERDPSPHAA